ncbi:hypothetical protein TNCV_1425321 [Trichonephila clavipes]|nr:hypothetical protein TNCV_1425321 [Trichonephila clavipes]
MDLIILRGRGILFVKVTDSWTACYEFESSTAEDLPCRGDRWSWLKWSLISGRSSLAVMVAGFLAGVIFVGLGVRVLVLLKSRYVQGLICTCGGFHQRTHFLLG